MVRTIGAQLALLMFGLATLAGLLAGNSAGTILVRAVVAMFAAYLIGQAAAWCARLVLSEFLRERKRRLDQEHLEALGTVVADSDSAVSERMTEAG